MLLGAHVSIAGGVRHAPARGKAIGCESIQIFSKNQQQWCAPPLSQEDIDGFRNGLSGHGIGAAVIHDSYLINLASPKPALLKRSRDSFMHEMERARLLGIPHLIFHPGSHVGSGEETGLRTIAGSLNSILEETRGWGVLPLIENAAGQGTNLGYTFEQIARIIDMVDGGVGVCFDTCHAFAAGYDLRLDYEKVISELDDTLSLESVKAIHLNDSKGGPGSRKDRHEHIGRGAIGLEPFRLLVNDERFESVPGILETPGFETDFGRNLQVLKSLRGAEKVDRAFRF